MASDVAPLYGRYTCGEIAHIVYDRSWSSTYCDKNCGGKVRLAATFTDKLDMRVCQPCERAYMRSRKSVQRGEDA